jgi:hypothetical protein
MPHSQLRTFIVGAVAPFAFIACADQSPVSPDATSHDVPYATILAQPINGTLYQLTVYATTVGTGAVLDAYVLDASGSPATSGAAAFYYCSLQGNPAPSEACLSGSGHWLRYGSAGFIHTDPPGPKEGHALLEYTQSPPSGTTIGFRFRYVGQGSGIANAWSDNVADYTWP